MRNLIYSSIAASVLAFVLPARAADASALPTTCRGLAIEDVGPAMDPTSPGLVRGEILHLSYELGRPKYEKIALASVHIDEGSEPAPGAISPYGTDLDGRIYLRNQEKNLLDIPLDHGLHTVVFTQMTGSQRRYVSPSYTFMVKKGRIHELKLVGCAQLPAVLTVPNSIRPGEAYYISGSHIGRWNRADRLHYYSHDKTWKIRLENVPYGTDFKIYKGPRRESQKVSVDGLVWQTGKNLRLKPQDSSTDGKHFYFRLNPRF